MWLKLPSPLLGSYFTGANKYVAPALNQYPFLIVPSLALGESESINLVTAHAHTTNCVGKLNVTICDLRSAIGEYDVLINDDTVDISQLGKPTLVDWANNTAVNTKFAWAGSFNSTLGGIVAQSYMVWTGAEIYYNNANKSAPPESYIIGGSPEEFLEVENSETAGCPSFRDPIEHVIQSLNTWMFESGAIAAKTHNASYLETLMDPGLHVNTTVNGHVQGNHNVFHTNLYWYLGAATLEAICIALILPTYMGYWRLGRPMSFSPLEIAKVCPIPRSIFSIIADV